MPPKGGRRICPSTLAALRPAKTIKNCQKWILNVLFAWCSAFLRFPSSRKVLGRSYKLGSLEVLSFSPKSESVIWAQTRAWICIITSINEESKGFPERIRNQGVKTTNMCFHQYGFFWNVLQGFYRLRVRTYILDLCGYGQAWDGHVIMFPFCFVRTCFCHVVS